MQAVTKNKNYPSPAKMIDHLLSHGWSLRSIGSSIDSSYVSVYSWKAGRSKPAYDAYLRILDLYVASKQK